MTAALRQRVLSALHLGVVPPGGRLPSIRATAQQLHVDPRLALVAYQILEGEELVKVRRRSGVFATAGTDFTRPDPTREWVVDTLLEARRRGIALSCAGDFFTRTLSAVRLRAIVAERTADQLWSFCDELQHDYGIATCAVDLDELDADPTAVSRLRTQPVDLVVTTLYDTRAVRALAREIGAAICAVATCAGLFAEVGRLLEETAVYFVVSDDRMEAKLQGIFAASPARKNLHVLVNERDALDVPPCAPVYLTRLTRRHLEMAGGADALLSRGLPEARVFSDETARELTRFILAANARALCATERGE